MKEQLKKTFGDSSPTPTAESKDIIKLENTFYSENNDQNCSSSAIRIGIPSRKLPIPK